MILPRANLLRYGSLASKIFFSKGKDKNSEESGHNKTCTRMIKPEVRT